MEVRGIVRAILSRRAFFTPLIAPELKVEEVKSFKKDKLVARSLPHQHEYV